MGTQTTPPAADSPESPTVPTAAASGRLRFARAGSLWFDLAIALVAGLLVRPDRHGARPTESAQCGLGDGRSGLSLHRMGVVSAGPACSLAAHLHRPAGLSGGRIRRPAGPESAAGRGVETAVTALAGAYAVLRLRGGALVCLAVLLRVSDLPSDSGNGPAGHRAVQRVLPACAAAELPVHGTLFADAIIGCCWRPCWCSYKSSRSGTLPPNQKKVGWGTQLDGTPINPAFCDCRGRVDGDIGWHQSVSRIPGAAGADGWCRQPALAAKADDSEGCRRHGLVLRERIRRGLFAGPRD